MSTGSGEFDSSASLGLQCAYETNVQADLDRRDSGKHTWQDGIPARKLAEATTFWNTLCNKLEPDRLLPRPFQALFECFPPNRQSFEQPRQRHGCPSLERRVSTCESRTCDLSCYWRLVSELALVVIDQIHSNLHTVSSHITSSRVVDRLVRLLRTDGER